MLRTFFHGLLQPRVPFRISEFASRYVLMASIAAAPAVEVSGLIFDVDRPEGWADSQTSHHGKHALSGALFASNAYMGLRLFNVPHQTAKTGARGLTLIAAVAYELDNGLRFGSWVDPVDVIWTACGGLLAFAGVGTETWVITPIVAPEYGGIAMGWCF